MSATDYSLSVDIAAPAERVFAVIVDVERWHEWTASITSVTRLDHGPLVVGSRARIKQPGFPAAEWQVTAVEPGRGFTWVSRAPGLAVWGHHYVVPTTTGCTATLSLKFEGVMGPLWAWLTRGINRKYVGLEAAGLKKRSEGV